MPRTSDAVFEEYRKLTSAVRAAKNAGRDAAVEQAALTAFRDEHDLYEEPPDDLIDEAAMNPPPFTPAELVAAILQAAADGDQAAAERLAALVPAAAVRSA